MNPNFKNRSMFALILLVSVSNLSAHAASVKKKGISQEELAITHCLAPATNFALNDLAKDKESYKDDEKKELDTTPFTLNSVNRKMVTDITEADPTDQNTANVVRINYEFTFDVEATDPAVVEIVIDSTRKKPKDGVKAKDRITCAEVKSVVRPLLGTDGN